MNYDLNITNLIRDALPSFLRGERQVQWLNALLKPVKNLRDEFNSYREQTNEKLQWNGQTINMRSLLRLRFSDNAIEITNQNPSVTPFYVYGAADARNPVFFGVGDDRNPKIWAPNAYDANAASFIVNVPFVLTTEQRDEMNALIKAYKIYGKGYKIEDQS